MSDAPQPMAVDTAPIYRALESARVALLAVPRSGASVKALAQIDAIFNAAPTSAAPAAVVPAPSAHGPEELWLQLHGDCDESELSEPVDYTNDDVTWCWHQIHNSDVCYVRADLVPARIDADKLQWTDERGVEHSMPVSAAVALLREFWDRWPGGLDEIEASVSSWRSEAIKRGFVFPADARHSACELVRDALGGGVETPSGVLGKEESDRG